MLLVDDRAICGIRPRVVDEDIEPSEPLYGVTHARVSCILVGDVSCDPECPFSEGRRRSFDGVLLSRGHDDGRTPIDQCLGDRKTDPSGCTGHDRDATLQG